MENMKTPEEIEKSKAEASREALAFLRSFAKMQAENAPPEIKNRFLVLDLGISIDDRIRAIVDNCQSSDDVRVQEAVDYFACIVGGLDAYMAQHDIPIPAGPAPLF